MIPWYVHWRSKIRSLIGLALWEGTFEDKHDTPSSSRGNGGWSRRRHSDGGGHRLHRVFAAPCLLRRGGHRDYLSAMREHLIVPNSQITNSIITNFVVNDTRRADFTVGVPYEDDLQKVRQLLETLIAEHSLLLKEPAPFIGVSDLAESSVNIVIRVWVKRRDFQKVRFSLLEQIKLVFDQHGITIPYPQRMLHMHNGLGGQAAALAQPEVTDHRAPA
jgi:Mechanosensitive ion channel